MPYAIDMYAALLYEKCIIKSSNKYNVFEKQDKLTVRN